jgi:hypothetical protein
MMHIVLALASARVRGHNGRVQVHREEGRFTIRIELAAEFDAAYEGDDDGYAWLRRWQEESRPRLARAVVDALRADARFDVIPTSRGGAPDENLELSLKLRVSRTEAG